MKNALVWMGIGIITVLAGALSSIMAMIRKRHCSVETQAVIAEVQTLVVEYRQDGSPAKTQYTPIYEFTAGESTVRKAGIDHSEEPETYQVGTEVPVRYNPENPEEFLIGGKDSSLLAGIVVALFGVMIALISWARI